MKDPLSFPACRITADFKDNEKKVAAFMQDDGAVVHGGRRGGSGEGPNRHDGLDDARIRWYVHGRQPRHERRRAVGFSHEAPNLGALGASMMGTSGAHNPTLTAQALAWRTAEHLAKHWKMIAG